MTNYIQIPISFSYQTTVYVSSTGGSTFTGESLPVVVPAATATCTVTNRATMNPQTVYSTSTGGSPISPIITDSGGNVPGYVPEGSYTISAAATGGFGGASVNWEAAYGAGVSNVASNAVNMTQLSTALQTQLGYYQPALPVGTLAHYVGTTDPTDADGTKRWMICDGRSLSTATYGSLHTVVGYSFGGSGANFNLPNGQNVVLMGSSGTYSLYSTGGEATHTLSSTEMPVHAHGNSLNDPTHAHSVYDPGHNHSVYYTSPNSATLAFGSQWVTNGWWYGANQPCSISATGIGIYGAATGMTITNANAGSGGSHNNLQPYLAVNHLIKVL